MPANNNTTGLSAESSSNGVIGSREFKDYSATQISQNISRNNYNKLLVSDKELQEFRDVVYKMVSVWTYEDKMFQLTAYGDASELEKVKNPTEEDVNRILTESIIIHLDPADLRQLRADMVKTKTNVKNSISSANKNRARAIKKRFNTNTFESAYEKIKNSNSSEKFKKSLKQFDPDYQIPKYILKQFPKLRKELTSVLNECFNKVELVQIAYEMGIEIPETVNDFNMIAKAIINKVCLYVSLIIGKGKNENYGNSIINPEPYNNLLLYTSYSYITGQTGLNSNQWLEMRNQARIAKKAIAERARLQSNKFKNNSVLKTLTNGVSGRTLGKLGKQLNDNDRGILENASYDDLIALAGRYGVDLSKAKNRNIGYLKAQIYNGMRAESQKAMSATKAVNNAKKRNQLIKQDVYDSSKIFTDYRQLINKNSISNTTSGDDISESIPTVEFTVSGAIKNITILRAVPVYVVGYGTAGKSVSAIKDNEKKGYGPKENPTIPNIVNISSKFNKKNTIDSNVKEITDLPAKDLGVLNYITSLPSIADPNGRKTSIKSLPRDLLELENLLIEQGANIKIFRRINEELSSRLALDTPDISFKRALRYCYLYAQANKLKKLESFLTNKYGIYYKNPFSKVRKFIKNVKNIVSDFVSGKALTNAITKPIQILRTGLFPEEYSQLTDESKKHFDSLNNPSMNTNRLITMFKNQVYAKLDAKKRNIVKNYEDGYYGDGSEIGANSDEIVMGLFKALNSVVYYKDYMAANLFLYKARILGEKGKVNDKKAYKDFKTLSKSGGVLANLFKGFKAFSAGRKFLNKKIAMDGKKQDPRLKEEDTNKPNTEISKMDQIIDLIKQNIECNREISAINMNIYNNMSVSAAKAEFKENYKTNSTAIMSNTMNKINENIVDTEKKNPFRSFVNNLKDKALEHFIDPAIVAEIKAKKMAASKPVQQPIITNVGTNASQIPAPTSTPKNEEDKDAKEIKKYLTRRAIKIGIKRFATLDIQPVYITNKEIERLMKPIKIEKFVSADAKSLGIKSMNKKTADPVFVANKTIDVSDRLYSAIASINSTISYEFATLETALGAGFELAAPMGVGKGIFAGMLATGITGKIGSAAKAGAATILNAMTANTGGVVTPPKFASGGNSGLTTSVITGDAPGKNIFANGARPELVSSNSNINIVPLNKTGTENQSKITRMTPEERKNALASAISSHIVKFNYTLLDGTTEVSNEGEAIKVYDVKPGLTDTIDLNGTKTSVVDLLSGIYTQLTALLAGSSTSNQLLTTIATKPTQTIVQQPQQTSSNPFAGGFPDSLDNILEGA